MYSTKWTLIKITKDRKGFEIGFARSDDLQVAFLPPLSMKNLRKSGVSVHEHMPLKDFEIKQNDKGKVIVVSSFPHQPRESVGMPQRNHSFKGAKWQVGKEQVLVPDTQPGSDHGSLEFACSQCGKGLIGAGQIFRIHRGAVWTNCELMLKTSASQWNEAKKTRFKKIHCFGCERNVGALYSQKYEGAEPGQPFPCCKLAIIRGAGINSSIFNNLVIQSTSRNEANDVVESLLKVEGGYCGGPVPNKRTFKEFELREESARLKLKTEQQRQELEKQKLVVEQHRKELEKQRKEAELQLEKLKKEAKLQLEKQKKKAEQQLEKQRKKAEQETAERLRQEAHRQQQELKDAGIESVIWWECEADDTWRPYSDDISRKIEDTYATQAGSIIVDFNGANYTIDTTQQCQIRVEFEFCVVFVLSFFFFLFLSLFSLRCQIRNDTGTVRRIRRRTKQILVPTKQVVIWECNASDTTVEKWCAYPSEINTKIENAHIAKKEFVTFVMKRAQYIVDLTSSPPEQIRTATKKRREMRRKIKTTSQAKSPQEQNDWTVEPDIISSGTQRWIIPCSQNASVCRDNDEFNKASTQYVKMFGSSASLPCRVDYYESKATSFNFQSKKDEFAKAGIPTKEIWVFHGTCSDENIGSIMSEGFKVGGSEVAIKNGNAYGRGIYTATGPRAPQWYAQGTNKVILARGLVGTNGVHSKTPKDDWYLFMDGHQLLPVYVLHM